MMLSFLLTQGLAASPALTARLDEIKTERAGRRGSMAPPIPVSAYDKVEAGKVMTGLVAADGSKARKLWGVGIFDVPIAKYFSAIADDKNKTAYTRLSDNHMIRGTVCGPERTMLQVLSVPILSDRYWFVDQSMNVPLQERTGGRIRELSWVPTTPVPAIPAALHEATDGQVRVDHTYGGWWLVDLGDDRTLVEFWTWSEPGGNVPAAASAFATGSLETTLKSMADLARNGPSCTL